MMKKISVFLLLLCVLLTLSLSGCHSEAKQPELPPVPEIPEDYLYLASENVYLDYGPWRSGSLYIPMLSAAPIAEDDVQITFDGGLVPDDFGVGSGFRESEIPMSFFAYQSWRGKDWDAFAAQAELLKESLDADGYDSEVYEKYAEMRDEYLEDYTSLQEAGALPVLYYYNIYLNLPVDAAFADLHEITLHIGDEAHTFPIGRISCAADSPILTQGDALTGICSIAGWNVQMACATGIFREEDETTCSIEKATEDVTITDIYLWEDEREISDNRILITQPYDPEASLHTDVYGRQDDAEVVADYLWDGKTPIQLKKGERICVSFSFHEPRLADKLTGYTQYYLTLEYQTENGDTYYNLHWYPMLVEPYSADPHEIYLAHELGIDVLSYYENYYLAE